MNGLGLGFYCNAFMIYILEVLRWLFLSTFLDFNGQLHYILNLK